MYPRVCTKCTVNKKDTHFIIGNWLMCTHKYVDIILKIKYNNIKKPSAWFEKKSLVFNLVENDKPFKKEFIKSTQQ